LPSARTIDNDTSCYFGANFYDNNERIWTYVDLVTNGCEAEEVDDLGGQNESILVRIPPNP
jgi:hypothetical protein